jgi:hypothetical protein
MLSLARLDMKQDFCISIRGVDIGDNYVAGGRSPRPARLNSRDWLHLFSRMLDDAGFINNIITRTRQLRRSSSSDDGSF